MGIPPGACVCVFGRCSIVAALLASIGLSGACGAASATRAQRFSDVINVAVGGKRASVGTKLTNALRRILIAELVSFVLQLVKDWVNDYGKRRIVTKTKLKLLKCLLAQDIEFFDGDRAARAWQMSSDIELTISNLISVPLGWIESATRTLATLGRLYQQSNRLAMLMVLLLPGKLALLQLLRATEERLADSDARALRDDSHSATKATFKCLLQNVKAFATMRSFSKEAHEEAQMAAVIREEEDDASRATFYFRIFDPMEDIVERSVEIAALWFGGRMVARGELGAGDLASYVMIASGVVDQLRFLYYSCATFSDTYLDEASEIANVLQHRPRIGLADGARPAALNWDIEFRGATFSYPHRPMANVLRDVSLRISSGEYVGFMGDVGSGKSTMLKLVQRMYDPSFGSVLVGGLDLRGVNAAWLRARVALVSQNPILFEGTILDNVRYGERTEGSASWAIDACQLRGMLDRDRFPDGLLTNVGDGGSKLSGGQRQKVAIARAAASRPRILLLDECTAAMDEATQNDVLECIDDVRRALGFPTTISVAHRASALRSVTRISCFHRGRLVESGRPCDLIADPSSMFSKFVRLSKRGIAQLESK